MKRSVLAVLVAAFVLPVSLEAQGGGVSIIVIDDATDAPLADVRIAVIGQSAEGVTDARGRFVYATPRPGKFVFLIRRLGYEPGSLAVDVVAGDTARLSFAMTAVAQTLSTVAVRDTMTSSSPFLREFDRRANNRVGSASYITRAEIDKRHPGQTTDLLRRVTSISIRDSVGILMAVSRRMQKPVIGKRGGTGAGLDLADCPLQVAVDGQLKEWGYAVNSIPPSEIYGIEIYPGPATIPAEYASMRRDAACGLIAVWTRRDK